MSCSIMQCTAGETGEVVCRSVGGRDPSRGGTGDSMQSTEYSTRISVIVAARSMNTLRHRSPPRTHTQISLPPFARIGRNSSYPRFQISRLAGGKLHVLRDVQENAFRVYRSRDPGSLAAHAPRRIEWGHRPVHQQPSRRREDSTPGTGG